MFNVCERGWCWRAVVWAALLGGGIDEVRAQQPRAERVQADAYDVGVAAIDITPEHPIRLNGFGGRRQESSGVRQPIWAKALAIGADEQGPVVLITVDILGIPDELVSELAERLASRTAVTRERLTLTATHTHSAPMLEGENETLFGEPIPDEHLQHIAHYTRHFIDKLEQVALDALDNRAPAQLNWGIGTVRFATNRRTAGGPVDHDLPVLTVRSLEDELRAVYVSYACHCVTLSDNQISGDWAGYAQAAIERDHPGAVALCSVGCGADLNPNSGVTGDRADIAGGQGEEVATEVRRMLGGYLAPIQGELTTRFDRVTLPLQQLPDRAQWEQLAEQNDAVGHHARVQLARLDRGEALIQQIDAPIQSWRFGDSLAIVFLPGETVVDYSLRLKRELDAQRLWVNGYANAACGYVPSERVLTEGGYEGGGAMIYYDIPTPYAAGLEQPIVDAVHAQVGDAFAARVDVSRTNGVAPLSPQQSAARIRSRPEMRAQLVAAEPLIVDPVAIDFAPDGSMWVAEMHDYPEGVAGDFQPGGSVRLVRDTNGDGVFDTSTEFLDGIPFPTGVTTWRNGVLICAAPDILYAEDTDRDDRADEVRVLFSGFGTGNYQGRVNSLVPGLDGWVYGSCGLFGGDIASFAGGEPFPLGDRDFRIQPDTGRIEPATGRTQQGRVRDDWDNWFGCHSGNMLFHYPLADHDLRRNPFLREAPIQVDVAPSTTLFPAVPPLTFELSGPPGLTTAACGLGIYRDDLLGTEFTGNSFTCEPVSQVVHRLQVTANGATFTAQRAVDEADREFLASADGWFRPVQSRTGPDGALWVVDMYRYIIEHPRWIPADDIARVDLRAGESLGRIYRVFPRENPARPIARLDALDSAGLMDALDSPNGPQRDLAEQLLAWRGDRSIVPALTEMAEHHSRPEARLHALAVLEELGAVDGEYLSAMLRDAHPGVRKQAVRIAGGMLNDVPELLPALLGMGGDADATVRVQLAASLGKTSDARAATAIVQLLSDHPGDPFLTAAAMSSISEENVADLLAAALAPREIAPDAAFISQLLIVAATNDDYSALRSAVESITRPSADSLAAWQTRALASLLSTLSEQARQLPELLGDDAAARLETTMAGLREVAADVGADEQRRLAALSVLGRDARGRAADLEAVRDLLASHESMDIQRAAVETLGRINSNEALDVMLSGWPSATPQVRGAIFDAAVDRPEWLSRVLTELEEGHISSVELDAARAARLVDHPEETVRQRAQAIFGRTSSDRQDIVEQYQAAAELAGDVVHGQALFQKTCSVCHRLNGAGHAVGPDLAPLANKSPEYLLLAMMDPSRAVDNRYLNYNVALLDGRILTGMLAAESGGSITLAMQEGKQESILRRDIDELRGTGKSMMPEGIERDLSVQDVADIIAYLRTPSAPAESPPIVFEGNQPSVVEPDESGRLLLLATNGEIHGGSIIFEQPFRNIGYWHGEGDHVDWTVRIVEEATCDLWMVYACDDSSAGNRFVLEGGAEPLRGEVPGTGGWSRYERMLMGRITLAAGEYTLTLRPDGAVSRALMDLHGLECVPVGNEPQLEPPTISAATPSIPVSVDPREVAAQLLNDALSVEDREALIAAHQEMSADLIAVLSEDLPSGVEEYRRIPWIWRVAIAAGRRNQDQELRSIIAVSLPGWEQPLRDWQAVVIGGGIINGLSQQAVWPKERIDSLLEEDATRRLRWDRLLELAAAMADDEQIATGTRYDALRIVGCGDWHPRGEQLMSYLAEGTNAELQMGAVSGLVDLDSPDSTAALAGALDHLTGTNRSLAIAGLLRAPDRVHALLDAIGAGSFSIDELSDEQAETLRNHPDASVRKRATMAADGTLRIVPELIHVRSGEMPEWSSFPPEPQATEIAVEFDSRRNAEEYALRLRQQDVKQDWRISINEAVLGELTRDENDQVTYVAIPAGVLIDGANMLRIRTQSSASDDIRVGEVGIIRRPLSSALDEARLSIRVIEEASGSPIPARITIIDANGALHPVAIAPGDQLAVRSGVIYTANGTTEFGLPAGRYTIYAGRGFEYSLSRVEVDLHQGESGEHALRIRREVPTEGYVACDTHVHTLTFSGHGDATIAERMVTLAGEGIELPVAADHNVHIDHEPHAVAAGLRQYFTPVIGNELTTPVGHFNIFPVADEARVPQHEHSSWGPVFDEIFATPGVRAAVLNHARDLHSGVRPFGPDHFNDAVGLSLDGWPYRMTAMEVVNSAAIQSDPLRLFRDWMTLLNAGYRVTPIGASDSHDVARHFVGQARTYIRCDDRDPGNIDVDAAVDSLLHGRVMTAYGLLAEMTVEGRYRSGEIAPLMNDGFKVRVRVLGPHWSSVETVQLYANGELIEERSIDGALDNEPGLGVKWDGEFVLPAPAHDQHLVALAIGPGVAGLYWPTAKPYQATSPDWEPLTIGCSGAVWLDADGDPGFASARDYAERAWAAADGDFSDLLNLLDEHDPATAAQAAALYHANGGSPTSDEFRSALTGGPAGVRTGFERYFHAWRVSEIARMGTATNAIE